MNENNNLNVAQATNIGDVHGIYISGQSSSYPLPIDTDISCCINASNQSIRFRLHVGDLPFNCKIKVNDVNGINGIVFDYDFQMITSYSKNGKLSMSFRAESDKEYLILLFPFDNFAGTFTLSVTTNVSEEEVKESLKRRAIDDKGGAVIQKKYVADPVDVSTGAHVIQNNLMQLFDGQKISFTAHYDSTSLVSGSLGTGWYHNYEKWLIATTTEAILYLNSHCYQYYDSTDGGETYTCSTPGQQGNTITKVYNEYKVNYNNELYEYYDEYGNLARMVDRHSNVIYISDTAQQLDITDGISDKSIYCIKDSTGKIVEVKDDCGRVATLDYEAIEEGDDEEGQRQYIYRLVTITDVNGNKLFFTYNNSHRIQKGIDGNGVCYFENMYSEEGQVCKQTDALGNVTTFIFSDTEQSVSINRNGDQSTREFDNNRRLVQYTDENGHTTTYAYDTNGNLITETDPAGNFVHFVYNEMNKPTRMTDKNGNITQMTYDTEGNLLTVTYPSADGELVQESFEYNGRNKPTKHIAVDGLITEYTYDWNGMPTSKKVGNKNACTYQYVNGVLRSETDAMGNRTTYSYNRIGLPISKTDALNRTTQFEYDNAGNLLKVTDPNGKSITYEYDCNHQMVAQTDANGNRTTYAYNGNMKQTSVTLPDGNTIRYEYDPEDRMVKTIDQAGNETVIEYDAVGQETRRTFANEGWVWYRYNALGKMILETDSISGDRGGSYDAMGNLISSHNGNDYTTYAYDCMNRMIRKTNDCGGITTYQYSKAGHLLRETNPLGHATVYTYDEYGNKLSVTDPKGNTTTFTYDANNNLLSTTDPLQNTTTFEYDCCNQLTKVTDANGHAVTYGYDALGRRTTVTDAKGNTVTTAYDANGNVLSITDAKGNVVSQKTYNAMNLPATSVDALGSKSYTYNALGKVAEILDTNDQSKKTFTYNNMGWNTKVTDEKGLNSHQFYDAMGNVTGKSGPLGGGSYAYYDGAGNVLGAGIYGVRSWLYSYGPMNLMSDCLNGRQQMHYYYYNNMGQLISTVDPDGSAEYTYDANGNRVVVCDGDCCIIRAYDALNRVISCTDTEQRTVQYQYDGVGNLTQLTYPDNSKVTYGYDVNNNLISVIDWAGRTTLYTYDANNQVIGITKPDGSVTTNTYDTMQRLVSSVDRSANGSFISGFEYTYDHLSRIVEEKDLAKNLQMRYTYDELSRVCNRETTDLCTGAVTIESFSYDAAGNITSAAGNSCFGYDANNRLTMYMDQSVTYDADGNMTAAFLNNQTTAFTYDSKNRLISDGTYTYFYNAEDVRVRSVGNCVENVYTYDTVSKLSRLLVKTTNGVTTKYVYGLGLIGEAIGSTFKTYHYDYRGSTVSITNASGAVTDTFAYDTYGKLIARTGSTNTPFLYNGRDGVMTEPNGLYYMRARYYSPELRRFINADILAGEISNAITLNRYAYANGNPVSNIDPFGLSPERGVITYKGEQYKIFVPDHLTTSTGSKWETVHTHVESMPQFDLGTFFSNLVLDDGDVLLNSDLNVSPKLLGAYGQSIFSSLVSSAYESSDNIFLQFEFQKSGDQRRVIIKLGSNGVRKINNRYAGTTEMVIKGHDVRQWSLNSFYEDATGEDLNMLFERANIYIEMDKRHKGESFSSYVWVANDGTIMQTPIVYEGDRVSLVKETGGIFYFLSDYKLDLPINGSAPISDEYQKLFKKALSKEFK